MSYGLNIINADGHIVIDDQFARFRVIQAGKIMTGGAAVQFPIVTGIPMIMIRPPYGRWVTAGTVASDRFSLHRCYGDTGADFEAEYVVMGRADDAAPPAGWGLNVFSATGKLLYSSQHEVVELDLSLPWTIGGGRGPAVLSPYPSAPIAGIPAAGTPTAYACPAPKKGSRYVGLTGMQRCGGASGGVPGKYTFTIEAISVCIDSETQVSIRKGWLTGASFNQQYVDQNADGRVVNLISGYR